MGSKTGVVGTRSMKAKKSQLDKQTNIGKKRMAKEKTDLQ